MKIFILFLVLLCNLAACVAPISETSNHNDIMKKCATDRDCPPAEYCRSGGCFKKPGTFASLKVRNNTAEELASEDATAGIPVVNTDDEKGKRRSSLYRPHFQPAMIMKKLMSSGMWQKKILHNLKERTEGPVHGSGNASQKVDVYVAFAIHVELLDILKAVQYFQSTIVKEISCWGERSVAQVRCPSLISEHVFP
ncbi:hypothetical protein BDV30DRAFT_244858 [Aspergillus minisclerotigenes]|uniref:Uncharacterized protein n=1 Tax=Aspergillus minisclerotigenes TaxID=656917 RepID=A0A5N6ILS1_9EURO|nr:hypothetical protein BDV30DRAFT_244858 [Aspergillus minisclerotigenes]